MPFCVEPSCAPECPVLFQFPVFPNEFQLTVSILDYLKQSVPQSIMAELDENNQPLTISPDNIDYKFAQYNSSKFSVVLVLREQTVEYLSSLTGRRVAYQYELLLETSSMSVQQVYWYRFKLKNAVERALLLMEQYLPDFKGTVTPGNVNYAAFAEIINQQQKVLDSYPFTVTLTQLAE